MSVIEKKSPALDISNGKVSKIFRKKKSIKPIKINLCKKYFYLDNRKAINLKQFNNGKILQLMESNNNKGKKTDVLEQVDYIMTQFERKKKELNQKKIDCIKSMILNNKKIPEKWIMKSNYKELLNQAMEDDIVLNYAIICKDIHKKSAGIDETDESRYLNYKKNLPAEKIFISYINPYSRNYVDSSKRKKLINDYSISLRKNNHNCKRNKYSYNSHNNSINNYDKKNILYQKINKKNNSFGEFSIEYNKLPLIKNKDKIDNEQNKSKKRDINDMTETKDDLMVTSLYYSGYNNDEKTNNSYKKDLKIPELPLI
jgi:hypothetical protein